MTKVELHTVQAALRAISLAADVDASPRFIAVLIPVPSFQSGRKNTAVRAPGCFATLQVGTALRPRYLH